MVNTKASAELGLSVSKVKMLDRPATSAGLSAAAEASPRRTIGRSFRGIPLDEHMLEEREMVQWGSSYTNTYKRPSLGSLQSRGQDWSQRRGTLAVAAAAYAHPYNKLHLTLEEKASRGPDRSIMAQKEAFGSTLDLCHRPSMLERPRFTKSSAAIGSRSRYRPEYQFENPRAVQYSNSSMHKSATRHAKFMEEFLTSRELNAKRPQTTNRSTYKISYEQEYPEGNNTRYAWPRNTSQVAAESFDAELDDNGQPTRDKDYGEDADATLVGRARDQHFTTTKAATDHVTVGTAYDEGAYATACTTGNVMRTVSADSPSWFQVPGAAVAPLTLEQLKVLVAWKAPLPRKSVVQEDGLDGVDDKSSSYFDSSAPLSSCPMRCTHAGCSLAREVILRQHAASRPASTPARGWSPAVVHSRAHEHTPTPPSRPFSTYSRPPTVRSRSHAVA